MSVHVDGALVSKPSGSGRVVVVLILLRTRRTTLDSWHDRCRDRARRVGIEVARHSTHLLIKGLPLLPHNRDPSRNGRSTSTLRGLLHGPGDGESGCRVSRGRVVRVAQARLGRESGLGRRPPRAPTSLLVFVGVHPRPPRTLGLGSGRAVLTGRWTSRTVRWNPRRDGEPGGPRTLLASIPVVPSPWAKNFAFLDSPGNES